MRSSIHSLETTEDLFNLLNHRKLVCSQDRWIGLNIKDIGLWKTILRTFWIKGERLTTSGPHSG